MKNNSLPLFGVGPFYVVTIFLITFLGIFLSRFFKINLSYVFLNVPMLILGVFFILFGIFIWTRAVFSSEIQKNIKEGKLVTTGIFFYVRNPIYSAFLILTTGIIFLERNLFLLFIPILNWIFLTVLMKKTEEKWLLEVFGKEYEDYCKKVNRCFPWKPKE